MRFAFRQSALIKGNHKTLSYEPLQNAPFLRRRLSPIDGCSEIIDERVFTIYRTVMPFTVGKKPLTVENIPLTVYKNVKANELCFPLTIAMAHRPDHPPWFPAVTSYHFAHGYHVTGIQKVVQG